MRRLVLCGAAVAVALIVHAVAGHLLAGRDVVSALLIGSRLPTVALVAALLAARLFLFLLAPGWALFAVTSLVLERRLTARDRSPR